MLLALKRLLQDNICMRIGLCFLAGLVLTLASPGAPVEEAAGLDVILLPTIQYAHQDIWTKTPNGRGPATTGVGQVVRGQPVHILVFATRFATGPGQIAEVDYRLSFIRPDGSAGWAKDHLRLITRGPAKEPRGVHKAVELATFVATQEDPLGTWRVVVEATDRISQVTVKREQPLTVVGDEVLTEPLPAGFDPSRWLMGYHFKPMPQQVLAVIKFSAEHPPAGAKPRDDAENGALLGFFEQVLTDNPWLLPHLLAQMDRADGRERALLSTLLAFAKRDDPAFPDSLPDALRVSIKEHQLVRWPVPDQQPLQGTQLDVLWGRFFASGRYEPIRALVAVLAYHPHKVVLEEYKKLKNKPAKPPVELYKSVVFQAAVWSLQSNIQQDKVVRDYCEGMLLRKELPAAEHALLAGAFQVAVGNLRKAQDAKPAEPKPD
ncbi:MAG: hypothetical protein PSV13_21480 [Lacunisphaera sp.]|nr:hypothetical protein [Lacunisphaera sp.]